MLHRLGFPEIGRNRRLVTAIGIDALGSGTWMPMSVLYFTVVTPVGLVKIGLALSLAAALAIPFALAVGSAVDRLGAKQVLLAGNLLQALGFATYPLAHSFWVVLIAMSMPSLGRTAVFGSYSAMVVAVCEPGEREQWFGFLGALRNAGFAVGGLAGGSAIAVGTELAFHLVVLANAASYLVSFALVLGVRVRQTPMRRTGADVSRRAGFREVLGDVGYRWLILANTGYVLGCVVLTLVIPVYVIGYLDLPGWLPGAVYLINTALIGLGQGLVVRRLGGALRWRVVVLAAGFMSVSFLLLLSAEMLATVAAIGVVVLAAVMLTLGEMVGGPVLAAMAAESPPPELRGRYLAVHQLSWNVSAAVAPLLYLWLLGVGNGVIWLTAVLVVLAGALCCLPLRTRLPLAAGRVARQRVPVGA